MLGVFVQLRILIAMSGRSDSWSDSSIGLHRDLQYLYLEPCLARPPRAHEPTQPRLGEAAKLQSEVRPAHLATHVRWRWGQQKIPCLPANGNAGTDASWDIWRREYCLAPNRRHNPIVIGWSKYRFTWWCHQMETFSTLLAICAGNSLVNSLHKGQWRGALMLSLICVWIKGWVNNGEAGDLRCYCAHYDIIVMD